jgi:signal transduction histidine kinase
VRLRLRLLFVLLVATPLVALALLGVWAARSQLSWELAQTRAVLDLIVKQASSLVDGYPAQLERELLAVTETLPADPDQLRALGRREPRLRRLLLLDRQGRLAFPPMDGPTSADEQRLIADTRAAWQREGPLAHPIRNENGREPLHGWLPPPGSDPLGLLFWRRVNATAGAGKAAVVVPGAAVLQALVERLPASGFRQEGPDQSLALLDPNGRKVYQWGRFKPAAADPEPLAVRALQPPLGAWRVAYFGPSPGRPPAPLGLAAGLAALAAVIVGAGVWLYRDSTRELRLAAQRVSFVNQVSHELKTPLTNVRLHAELLEDHVEAGDPEGSRRLGIVIAESQRLGRLITNILSFASAEKGKLRVHPAPASVDEVVADVLAQFAPGLEAQGVKARLQRGAPGRALVDADALSQMLGNLLGNVEKYAPGGDVTVATQAEGSRITVTVQDSGPGIPRTEWQRVFRPFVRLADTALEGVPGTGIGLGLARDLARLHGGDLQVIPSARGACFQLTLTAEPVT